MLGTARLSWTASEIPSARLSWRREQSCSAALVSTVWSVTCQSAVRILKSKAKSASPVHLILLLKPSIVTTVVTSFGGRHAGSALHLISHHSKGPMRPCPTACGRSVSRAGSKVGVRIHVGARLTLHHSRVCPHGRARRQCRWALVSRPTRTCCGTPAALHWPIRDPIRGLYRPTWGTRISSTRCGTPSWRRTGSRTSGDSNGA